MLISVITLIIYHIFLLLNWSGSAAANAISQYLLALLSYFYIYWRPHGEVSQECYWWIWHNLDSIIRFQCNHKDFVKHFHNSYTPLTHRLVTWMSTGMGYLHQAGHSQYAHELSIMEDIWSWGIPSWSDKVELGAKSIAYQLCIIAYMVTPVVTACQSSSFINVVENN